MLTRRLISAAVIISVMIALVTLDHWLGRPSVFGRPGIIISLVTIFACVVAAGELVDMWRRGGAASAGMVPTLLGVIVMASGSCLPMFFFGQFQAGWPLGMFGGSAVGITAALVIIAVTGLLENQTGSGARTDGIARGMLAAAYMYPLVAFLAPHRLLHDHNGSGLCALLLILATTKMSDACAFAFGKTLGRTRMAPRLSPNKTVEGGVGGMLGGVGGAMIVFWCVAPSVAGPGFGQSVWWIVGYGIVVSLAGVAGDLFESLLKRDSGCKDSSAWLPGLGGVMDIVDSLVFAAPVSWLYWLVTGAL